MDFKTERLEGEISPKVHLVMFAGSVAEKGFSLLLDRVSSARKLFDGL